MAPRHKVSEEQLTFLRARMPDFLQCSTKKSFSTFWTAVHSSFFARFPEREALVNDGILPGPGDLPLPLNEYEKIVGEAIKARKIYITNWYRNEAAKSKSTTRPGLKGAVRAKFSKKTKRHRLHQPEEMYDILHKEKITALAHAYTASTSAVDSESESTIETEQNSRHWKMKIRRQVRREAWCNETEETREEVEKALKEEEEEKCRILEGATKTLESRTPEQIQEALDQLMTVLTDVGTEIYDLTGWSLTCLAGGPRPIEGGKLAFTTVSVGMNEGGHTFVQAYGSQWESIVSNYGDWLKTKYTPEVRAARALLLVDNMAPSAYDINDESTEQNQNVPTPQNLPATQSLNDAVHRFSPERFASPSTPNLTLTSSAQVPASVPATRRDQTIDPDIDPRLQVADITPQEHPTATTSSAPPTDPPPPTLTLTEEDWSTMHVPQWSRPAPNPVKLTAAPKPKPPTVPKAKKKRQPPAKKASTLPLVTETSNSQSQTETEVPTADPATHPVAEPAITTMAMTSMDVVPDGPDPHQVEAIPGGWGRQHREAELKKKQRSKALRNTSGDYPLAVFPAPPAGTEPLKRMRKAATLADGSPFVRQVKVVRDSFTCSKCSKDVLPERIKAKEGVIKCKKRDCETVWFHTGCVDVEAFASGWTCDLCAASASGAKRPRIEETTQ